MLRKTKIRLLVATIAIVVFLAAWTAIFDGLGTLLSVHGALCVAVPTAIWLAGVLFLRRTVAAPATVRDIQPIQTQHDDSSNVR